jgi:copper transport protein
VVARAPHAIVLRFDQPVEPVSGGTSVVADDGSSVLGGPPHAAASDVRQLVVPLQPSLPDGDYTVRWSVVSTDGHLISGVLAIGVGRGRPPPQAATTESSSETDWPYLAARFAYFAGLVLLVGGVVARLAVTQPVLAQLPPARRGMAELRETHRATQVLTLAAALMLAGGWVALTRQGSEVAGVSFWQAFNHSGPVGSALEATRFGRQFGRGIDVAAAFVVAAAVAFGVARRWPAAALAAAVPAAALGAWTMVVPGLSGHAGDPGRGTLAVAVDALHVAAAAVWIGGLAQLVFVVPHALRGLAGGELAAARLAVTRRFSAMAIACVVVVGVTGVARALWEVGAPGELASTGYGRALLVKTALFAAVLGLGYRNRHALDRFADVRRRAAGELALLGVLIAVVAVLTNLPPANTPSFAAATGAAPTAPAPGVPQVVSGTAGRIAVWPGTAGANWLAVRMAGAGAPPVMTVQPARGAGFSVRLRRAGDAFAALVPKLAAGTYEVSVGSGAQASGARLRIGRSRPVPPPPRPRGNGAVAAEEASDVAVGLQRLGRRAVLVTLIGRTGAGVPDALVTADGRAAFPCPRRPGCFRVAVPARATTARVEVRRPGRPAVAATLRLPAADAPPAAGLLRRAAAAFRALRSVRAENVLASDPTHSITTTFIAHAPNRLLIDVHGGQRSIIIGARRYDLEPDGRWRRSPAVPSRVPDPFWAPHATAVHVAGRAGHTLQLTLVLPGGPTFFRLWLDDRTRLVTRLRMITAAHFMTERELDFNTAPPVTAPTNR